MFWHDHFAAPREIRVAHDLLFNHRQAGSARPRIDAAAAASKQREALE